MAGMLDVEKLANEEISNLTPTQFFISLFQCEFELALKGDHVPSKAVELASLARRIYAARLSDERQREALMGAELDAQIQDLYSRMAMLANAGDEEAAAACEGQLRKTQEEAASLMRRSFGNEARRLKGSLDDELAEARRLLARDEDSASSDSAQP